MKLYLVTYDLLGKPSIGDYKSLFDALEGLEAKRVLLSVWVFEHDDTTCETIRDHLVPHLHAEKDRLLVVEAPDWAGWNLLFNPNDF